MKLTLPATEPGCCRVVADGLDVGFTAQHTEEYDGSEWTVWSAHLWTDLSDPDGAGLVVTRPTLRELRAALRERLETEGPWWK